MKIRFAPILALLILACLTLGSCVELDGQRVSMFYDAAKDELRLLFFYDGIHENKTKSDEKGEIAIPKFVKNGDVMLMDWWAQFKLGEMREAAAKPEAPLAEGQKPKPAARALLLAAVASIKTNAIGRYVDADEHVGAAQLVVISNASKFVEKINAAINEEIVTEDVGGFSGPNSKKLWIAAAKANRQWIKIEGHSISGSIPVHMGEWATAKNAFFKGIIENTISVATKPDNAAELAAIRRGAPSLASVVTSYDETGGEVRVRIGDPKTPTTMRLQIRSDYEPSLETVVAKAVPAELTTVVAAQILDGKSATPGAADIVAWGPPEETARALLAATSGKGPELNKANEQLKAWVKNWNASGNIPAAPEPSDGSKATRNEWNEWFRKMSYFPADGPVTTQPAK